MIINLFEPSAEKRAGGLDSAIRPLENYLLSEHIDVRCNPTMEKLRASREPQVVHFHGIWEPRFLKISASCRRACIPYVVSPHGMLEPWERRHKRWKKWPWFQLFERQHLAGAARLLTTSDGEARNLATLFPSEKCSVLPLGLTANRKPDYATARRVRGWGDSEIVLLFLSRIHRKKGLHLLLKALARLDAKTIKRVRMVIVGGGDPPYIQELMAFVERERMRLPKITWTGEVWGDVKWTFFQGADLFCLTSFSENFGLAVLEALQVGTRVLTTNRTPWNALPSWGGGLAVDATEEAVHSALVELLGSPAWPTHRRAQLAADTHERFSWEAVGPPYLRFYREVLYTTMRGSG